LITRAGWVGVAVIMARLLLGGSGPNDHHVREATAAPPLWPEAWRLAVRLVTVA